MKEKLITITQKELEQIVYEEVQKERKILFDIHMEDYFLLPIYKEKKYRGRSSITMSKMAWETHLEQLAQLFGELELTRHAVEAMEPVYKEYHELYEKEHTYKMTFDDYIKMVNFSYSADELERVRDKVEEMYYKSLDDEELER